MILFLFSERQHYATFLASAIIRCQLREFKNWLFTFLFTSGIFNEKEELLFLALSVILLLIYKMLARKRKF